jgi:hypothetical protein
MLLGPLKAWGLPVSFQKIANWGNYSDSIIPYRDQADLILVDGRFRIASALEAINTFNYSGYIIIHDFFNRPYYHYLALKYLKIVDCADNLVVLKKREGMVLNSHFQDELKNSKNNFERR